MVSVRERLLDDRRALLDLGTRNRLIHIPLRTKNIRAVEIVDESAAEVFSLLGSGKRLTFLATKEASSSENAVSLLPQPADRADPIGKGDLKLQTKLSSEALQKRLLDIWYDARTLEEEQGVNVLYLGMGLLRWFEDDSSDIERIAPLILLPVRLGRSSAAERFHVESRGEPPSINLSLQAKLLGEFSVKIEDLSDEDEVDLPAYFESVAATISQNNRWEVLTNGMVLGFFSFSKFLMYRDLDPDTWPEGHAVDQNELIASLLGAGFEANEPFVGDHEKIDDVIPLASTQHVVDADSSQTVAIEEVVRGRHLVIKGPPGTGKSQTITNILASAVASGKKVLFVAEKMAALDVVHRRLKNVGLSGLALELHSSKANKKIVLEELKRTLSQSAAIAADDTTLIKRLNHALSQLNDHAELMHAVHRPSELTPYQLLGNLVRSRSINRPAIDLSGAATWNPHELEGRREIVTELAQRVAVDGLPHQHPWRGSRCEALDPSELENLGQLVALAAENLEKAGDGAEQASSLLGYSGPVLFQHVAERIKWLEALLLRPECDRSAFLADAWSNQQDIADVLASGERFSEYKRAFDAAFIPSVWESSFEDCRAIFAAKSGSIFRVFSSRYRFQFAYFSSFLLAPMPATSEQRVKLLDAVLSAQKAKNNFSRLSLVGSSAFGSSWRRERSDWQSLRRQCDWVASVSNDSYPADFRQRAAPIPLTEEHREMLAEIQSSWTAFGEAWHKILAILNLDIAVAFGPASFDQLNLTSVLSRLQQWKDQPERVTRWTAFRSRTQLANELGLKQLVNGLLEGALPGDELLSLFNKSYFEVMRSVMFAEFPQLKKFDGEVHDRLVDSFKQADLGRLKTTRQKIASGHAQAVPRQAGGIGALGVLHGEIAKKRKHLPIRQLLDRAGSAIQQIKPVFMMSPLSVAQFLKPGAISFDLLVVDEASQIEPVDALGAIARCGQMVVVGDERQLPPTKFFAKLTGDIDDKEEDEEVTFQAKDAESILDLCLAKGVPHRMLNWHYRSKHQSLIAVSNKQFYDSRLFIVPSPYDSVAGMGLKFSHLPDAHYDRGNTRTNPKEARRVAEAVIAHAKMSPERSLGVATFSVAQRQAIQNELEILRRENPGAEEFFSRGTNEPFFIKNLENIQGDERDVIFISIGYGRSSAGYISMNFGPITREGGERRLNVLISRAKLQCHVFSSITSTDIDTANAKGKGLVALKMFLEFAQTGRLGIAEGTGRGPDSVFEEQVAERLAAIGHDVQMQIGSAGFFIDLAIADKEKPGRFILGIECDGVQYHSSRSARDRDRLRQAVLEQQGWVIHRIWSTDWFLRPEEELAKIEVAIAAAKARWQDADDNATTGLAVPLLFTANADGEVDAVTAEVGETRHERLANSIPYEVAELKVDKRREPHEITAALMSKHVVDIVAVEGPIHELEIVARVRDAWGLQRAGNRIRDAVQSGIAAAKSQRLIEGKTFYVKPGTVVRVRDRSDVTSASLRKPETLPPEEIKAAIVATIEANFGAQRDLVAQEVARALGFASTSAQLRSLINECVNELRLSGALIEAGMFLHTRDVKLSPST